ncbi:hypothetical protein LTR96_011094 [Exophiala xenobiotica]|nr:hypothetical protein LTR72_011411 [Exophiala xenobiotica]KAK5263510.1 hypothetical protein LTR96_011094 [Exophiala xenobiotica]KAK5284890.1 hypothetical protein LTR14_011420 [Exophiala xenobiotica]KAK5332754.1 hypothetical protein LTR98_011126 [Exophiala xenobiotica]KAK5469027.1 hypothetical protein LTR55_011433 [Exophiala xenobiotica]
MLSPWGINKLTNVTHNLQTTIDALNEATERLAIIRKVLDHTSGHDLLWKVAEECYNQAISLSGDLDADDYFDSLEETRQGWQYDPDYQSEEY